MPFDQPAAGLRDFAVLSLLARLGQTGMIGNPAARKALEAADLLLMVGTDFPYADWYPKDTPVVQIDLRTRAAAP